ncbi:unnamed protein product [Spodoptera exigua]|uniref:Cuticular protein n=1 Tax=Spodoptera exigua TaxID=7107 RepID=A0A922SIN8_SPOEX|nr:hypothetical protein HF086_002259 [Spodoptera exigua]CAH0687791.1 unnamed protein product [Spodoptera exigua]
MKLLLIFAAILAFSLAEEKKKEEVLNDSEAEASATIELMKEGVDLNAAASSYNSYVPPSQRPPHWNVKPIQPVQTSVPVQNDYYEHNNHQWSSPVYHPPTTTTPVSVIKNEQYYGENGHYKYEYQIADGTHVGEEGYFTDPKQTEESLVKKGWYSYVGADGKKYLVTYWADKTGFHAYGDHLPTPPPPYNPNKQPEVDNNRPLYDYPTQTQAPAVFYPTQPAPVPVKPIYVPPQPTLPPVQQPTYAPQPSYPPQNYYPPQQTYYPPQQNYYPQQQQNHI